MFLLVLGGFAGYVYTQQPVYRAGSLVMLDLSGDSRSQGSRNSPLAVGEDRLFASNSRSLTGEIFLLENSKAVARRVAKRVLALAEEESSPDNLSILQTSNGGRLEEVESVVSRLGGYLSFHPAHSDINAIRVLATSPQPGEASLLANMYAQEYVQLTQEENRSHLASKRESLERQEEKWREELRAVERKIENYMIEHEVTGEGGQGSQVVTRIAQLEAEREDAQLQLEQHRTTLESLKQQLEKFDESVATGIAASGTERKIEGLQDRIAQLELEKEEIYLRYPELRSSDSTNENLQEVNRQIEQLQSEVSRLSREYIDQIGSSDSFSGGTTSLSSLATLKQRINETETAMRRLEARVEVIDQRLEVQRSDLESVPAQSLEIRQLQRTKAYAERMHQLVVERLQETRVAEESEPGYAHILQEASPGGSPQRPEKTRYLILGCFLGLLTGIGAALVLDKVDNRIYKPEGAIKDRGGLLGVIPSMHGFIRQHHDGQQFVEYRDRQIESTVVSLLNPGSSVSEAYRQVRTKLTHGQRDTGAVRSLVVTSAGTKDGKSVTAANLAVTLAKTGQRTVLVDADLRRPRIHEIFDIEREPGLVQLFLETHEGNVSHEIIPNLHVLTAGQSIGNAAELLESKKMRRIFERLYKNFDSVVVDTPPSLVVADAAILSTYCDGVLVVCRAGQTKEKELQEVVETFEDVGSRIAGFVLNGFDVSSAYGHRYKYREYGQYESYFDNDRHIVEVGTSTEDEHSFDI
jgi:capsular exopolysaccharide synthesis family protein